MEPRRVRNDIQGRQSAKTVWFAFFLLPLLLSGCRSPQIGADEIQVTILADGETRRVSVRGGSTVSQALEAANISLGDSDRVEPPLYTVLEDGDQIRLTRVQEIFETEEVVIPYERQVVRNESLPEGERRLIQPGANGRQEITYRRVLEDGVEVARTIVKAVMLQEALPEIEMVGAQSAFAPLPIPGKLAYLAGGNAWVMEGTTANRRPLVTSGDLDGRIFALSPNGDWLLFSRKSTKSAAEEINTLWVVSTSSVTPNPIDLKVSNVVHFAAWMPTAATTIYYSTVEPRAAAPGWQANNDLYKILIGPGWAGKPQKIMDANSGGVYGWWGTGFAFSPESRLAYIRPDEIGLVNQEDGSLRPLLQITPLQTRSDWAWLPGLAWGADGRTIFFVSHAPPPSLVEPEASPYFDLSALSLANGASVRLVLQTGMFAYPSVSPLRPSGKERLYQVAYLQAIFPDQSEISRYRLMVMDRDGSNRRSLFPPADAPGLEPQIVSWTPQPVEGQTGDLLAVVYQGNLWLIDSGNGQTYQITGDGLITRIDWR